MLVDIHLTDTETGHSGVYPDEFVEGEEAHQIIYQYTEGNYACDCNLSLFLYDWEEDKKKPCGDTIRLDKIVDHATGQILY
jgi:hypothetical protein